MRNLIYQFWDTKAQLKNRSEFNKPKPGEPPPGVLASSKSMEEYAHRIGCDYLFEIDPPYLHENGYKAYYGAVNPVFRESFHEYDNVLFTDADVFAVDDLQENPFDGFEGDIAMAQEIFEPRLQIVENRIFGKKEFENWGNCVESKFNITLPRNRHNLLKVFNSGVVLYSQRGMKKAQTTFISFNEYINTIISDGKVKNFFAADQHYIHTSMLKAKLEFRELDYGWNTKVNFFNKDTSKILFDKNDNTKLVHIQLRRFRWDYDDETLRKIVNLPVSEWGLGLTDITNEMRDELL